MGELRVGEWRSGRIDVRVEHVERVDFNVEARRFCTFKRCGDLSNIKRDGLVYSVIGIAVFDM